MARRRPSYISIRRRQRNIIEGMGTSELKYAETAKKFGVTKKQLKDFLETRPKNLRRGYNQSPARRKLFEAGERSEVRKTLNIKRIRKYEFRENVLNDKAKPLSRSDFLTGRMVQRIYYVNDQMRQNWSVFARENDLPNSIKTIKFLYHNGKINISRYRHILKVWKNIYSDMSQSHFDSYWSEVDDGTDEESDE